MSSILTTARLVCKDTSSRTTVIAAFRAIIAYTAPHEPEVLQYVCALPVDDTLGTEIYMIEEYALPYFFASIASAMSLNLNKWFQTQLAYGKY